MSCFRELLHLNFQCFQPHPALTPWVQCYWSVRHPWLDHEAVERFYPDGASSLVFDFSRHSTEEVHFSVVHHCHSQRLKHRLDLFGIRFQPAGALRLLGLPTEREGYWNYRELGMCELEALSEALFSAEPDARRTSAEDWLLRRLAALDLRPGLLERLMPVLGQEGGGVQALVANAGASRRKVERLFRHQVGLSPQRLAALLRLKKARGLIKQDPGRSLAEVALRCGYYDQAHFIRSFRNLTGFTPGQYRQRQLQRLARGEMAILPQKYNKRDSGFF